MPRQLVTENVDGESYTFGYLLTSETIEIATEVIKLGLPAIAGTVKEVLTKADMEVSEVANQIDLSGLADALAASLEPKTVSRLVAKLCSVVTAMGGLGVLQGPIFEDHFMGRPDLALRVAVKSFEVNGGGNFLKAAARLGGAVKPALIPGQPKSTGSSGVQSVKKPR